MKTAESMRQELTKIFREQLAATPDDQVLAVDDPAEFVDQLLDLLLRSTGSKAAAKWDTP